MPIDADNRKAWLMAAILGWILFLLPYLLALARGGGGAIESHTDDIMRLVEVRDLIAGRGWFDHIQPRLGLDGGTFMHWSRLVDAPIAGIVLLFTPLLGQAGAETVALVAWPLAVGFVPIAAAAFAAQALTGARGAVLAAILMAQMLILTTEFDPGSLDHHNVQVALLVAAVCLAAIGLTRPRAAAGAGTAVAASVAVGIETLPHVALLGLFMALWWVAKGAAARAATTAFFLGLAATLVLIFVTTAPPEAWAGGFCDSLSVDQALPMLVASLGMASAARLLAAHGPGWRLAVVAVLAAVTLGMTSALAPACLSNPVGELDPWLRAVWFDSVNEVQPLFAALRFAAATVVPNIAVWTIGTICTLALIVRGRNRGVWIAIALMLAAVMAMSLWQARGARFAGVLAVLPVIAVVDLVYARGEARGRPALRLGALLLFFLAVPHFWAFAAYPFEAAQRGDPSDEPFTARLARCDAPGAYAALADLQPGLVSAGSNLGPAILLATPHRVLSAPYHRNQAGMIAQFRIDFASDADAEQMLRDLGVDYVASCADNIEFLSGDGGAPGFSFRLNQGEAPDFLIADPSNAGDPAIRIYRVAP